MPKHFEFTDETTTYNGVTLHRIRATKDLPRFGVMAGDLGGFLEHDSNLTGKAWVADNAKVFGNAIVSESAFLGDNSVVCDSAWVSGNARVLDNAYVSGKVWVSDNARVTKNARVTSHVVINKNALVTDHATVDGDTLVTDNASIRDHATAGGYTIISGHATMSGRSRACGSAEIRDHGEVKGEAVVEGLVYGITVIDGDCTNWCDTEGGVIERRSSCPALNIRVPFCPPPSKSAPPRGSLPQLERPPSAMHLSAWNRGEQPPQPAFRQKDTTRRNRDYPTPPSTSSE